MSKKFVTLTTEEFKDWADDFFGTNEYNTTTPKNGTELVIRFDCQVEGLEIHIFTSIEPHQNQTRAIGEDAIRVHLFDRFAGMIAHAETKILRVEGETTVWDRLTERTEALVKLTTALKKQDRFCKCKQNRVHTRKLLNKKTNETFYGCAMFPRCKNPQLDRLQFAKDRYPLKFNPFENVTSLVTTLTPDAEKKLTVSMKSVYDINSQKAVPEFKTWEVLEEAERVPTKEWTLVKYPFDYFNRVQSTCLKSDIWKRDVNFVLGTATSSGKTITAELLIAHTLNSKSMIKD